MGDYIIVSNISSFLDIDAKRAEGVEDLGNSQIVRRAESLQSAITLAFPSVWYGGKLFVYKKKKV